MPSPETLIPQLRARIGAGTDFDRLASEALLQRFGAEFVDPDAADSTSEVGEVLAGKRRFEGGLLYLRVGEVGPALVPQLQAALQDADWTRDGVGLVLDLRFARGQDFGAAGRAGSLFCGPSAELLDWGSGRVGTVAEAPLWNRPVAVLVNGETHSAAGALAGLLRREASAILVGQKTAPDLAVIEQVTFEGGVRVRLPVSSVKLGDGSVLPRLGLEPDIVVRSTVDQDRVHLKDPFLLVAPDGKSNVNAAASTPRRRINEAELVRAQREGTLPGDSESKPAPQRERVQDPALARAMDLLRGLSILRKS